MASGRTTLSIGCTNNEFQSSSSRATRPSLSLPEELRPFFRNPLARKNFWRSCLPSLLGRTADRRFAHTLAISLSGVSQLYRTRPRHSPRVGLPPQSEARKCRIENSIWPSGRCRHFSMTDATPPWGAWSITSRALQRAASSGSVSTCSSELAILYAKSRGRARMSDLLHWSNRRTSISDQPDLEIAIRGGYLSPLSPERRPPDLKRLAR